MKALMEQKGLSAVGWYHSHPVSEPKPSQNDVHVYVLHVGMWLYIKWPYDCAYFIHVFLYVYVHVILLLDLYVPIMSMCVHLHRSQSWGHKD